MNIAKPLRFQPKKKGHLDPKHPNTQDPKHSSPQTTSPKMLPSKTACSKLKPVAPPRVLRYLGGWKPTHHRWKAVLEWGKFRRQKHRGNNDGDETSRMTHSRIPQWWDVFLLEEISLVNKAGLQNANQLLGLPKSQPNCRNKHSFPTLKKKRQRGAPKILQSKSTKLRKRLILRGRKKIGNIYINGTSIYLQHWTSLLFSLASFTTANAFTTGTWSKEPWISSLSRKRLEGWLQGGSPVTTYK